MFFGLLIFALGCLLLLGQIFAKSIWFLWKYFWPSFLIIYGIKRLTEKNKSRYVSMFIIALGGLSILRNIGFLRGSVFTIFMAIILILYGLKIMLDEKTRKNTFSFNVNRPHSNDYDRSDGESPEDEEAKYEYRKSGNENTFYEEKDIIDDRFIFTQANRIYKSDNFSGGRVEADFSDVTLDLKNVWPLEDIIHLDLTINFGNVKILVPSDWHVTVNGTHYYSTSKSNDNDDTDVTLVINSKVFAGNLKIV